MLIRNPDFWDNTPVRTGQSRRPGWPGGEA